jgi:hypothetical protein
MLLPIRHVNPAEFMPTRTSHVVAPLILLDGRVATWTWLGGLADDPFRRHVLSFVLRSGVAVLAARLAGVPANLVDEAHALAAGAAGDAAAAFAVAAVLAGNGGADGHFGVDLAAAAARVDAPEEPRGVGHGEVAPALLNGRPGTGGGQFANLHVVQRSHAVRAHDRFFVAFLGSRREMLVYACPAKVP